jgi:hypothetical protein
MAHLSPAAKVVPPGEVRAEDLHAVELAARRYGADDAGAGGAVAVGVPVRLGVVQEPEGPVGEGDVAAEVPFHRGVLRVDAGVYDGDLHARPGAPALSSGIFERLGRGEDLSVCRPRESFHHPPNLQYLVAGCLKQTSRVPSFFRRNRRYA